MFAVILPALLCFPAKLPTQNALVSKLWGKFRGFDFSLPWIKCVCVSGAKFLNCQCDTFLRKPIQNRFSTKQSSFFSQFVIHGGPFGLHLPHSSQ